MDVNKNSQEEALKEALKTLPGTLPSAAAMPAAGAAKTDGTQGSGIAMPDMNTHASPKAAGPGSGSQSGSQSGAADEFDDGIAYINQLMQGYEQPLTAEEIAKQKQRRKARETVANIADAMHAISNLYFTTQYAPNSYDPNKTLTKKQQERWDKADADRKANDQMMLQLALQRAKLMGQKADRLSAQEAAKQQQANWQATFNFQQAKQKADEVYRERQLAAQEKQRDLDNELKKKEFELKKEQADRGYSIQKQELGIKYAAAAKEKEKSILRFDLGNGEWVSVPTSHVHAQSASRVFATLPQHIRNNVQGKPILEPDPNSLLSGGKKVVGYEKPTEEDMWKAIGEFVAGDERDSDAMRQARETTRNAIRDLSNDRTQKRLPNSGKKNLPGQ